jgi:hypothetical protein
MPNGSINLNVVGAFVAGAAVAALFGLLPGMKKPGRVALPGNGVGVAEVSVKDCRDLGGKVEVHDGCAKVGGNEVGLKCVIGDYASCIDEAIGDD